MKQYRAALLVKEFPFLTKLFVDAEGQTIFHPRDVDQITVARGDKTLLKEKGMEDSYDWSGGGHFDYTYYFAIMEDGEIVLLDSAGKSATGSGDRNEWDAPTVGEQLFEGQLNPAYIVECSKQDTDDNGNGQVRHTWTIHKMARFDMAAHHSSQIYRAAAELKEEIALACS